MPKKPTQNHNQQPQIVDQQSDPMLRALQKKVRNINKKLNEISELAARKDLKPEQEEKISKKKQVVEQKEKYQEMIQVYKEIASENIKIIRKTQLSELDNLASIIAVREYGADLPSNFNQSVDSLVKILINPSRELTIQQRVAQISEALIKNANNEKLRAAVKTYIELNPQRKINGDDLSNQPEAISPRSERERESEIRELVQEQRKQIQHKVICQEPLTPQVVSVARNLENTIQTNSVVENQKNQSPQPTQPVTEVNVQPSQVNNDQKNVVAPKDGNANQQRRNERNMRGDRRGRGGRGRGGRPYEDRGDKTNKKPSFKPKYQEKNPTQNQHDSDDSESSEPKARDFKREEVRDLINDGFIVVGKPKPKGRDQKQFHDYEHGRKFHPHNQKKDY